METNPLANSIAEVNRMFPLYKVEIQLNTFTADGTAMIKVNITKKFEINGFTPDMNIWCAQTRKERKPIASMEYTMALYPKIGFLECTESTSLTKPMAGRIMI